MATGYMERMGRWLEAILALAVYSNRTTEVSVVGMVPCSHGSQLGRPQKDEAEEDKAYVLEQRGEEPH